MSNKTNPENFVGREDEDISNVVFSARLRKGKTTTLTPHPFRRGWVTRAEPEIKRVVEQKPTSVEKRDKIHPVLKEFIKTKSSQELHEIMIVFQEDIQIPRFPEPDDRQPRDSEINQKLLHRADDLVKEIVAKRQDSYRKLNSKLKEAKVKVLENFWIINASLVEMALGNIQRLADYP
ncbi:MAG TPA: hypothetical protein VK209_06360, partial [Candidatus Sulfotelmatobacter sp.]|nr:hypothetical protein [Candidatus Sulfotelmatobacter sp.]